MSRFEPMLGGLLAPTLTTVALTGLALTGLALTGLALTGVALTGCSGDPVSIESETQGASSEDEVGSTETETGTESETEAGTETESGTETETETETGTETDTGTETETGTTGEGCTKNVVLMGYWPPTNEMLRLWSQDPEQNPEGWTGANWGGHGFDVYAFFPEFPPDGDPTNDPIGSPGSVGSPDYPLQVDYQATSADFWQVMDELDPVLLITTSRGGNQIGWELEAIEGGHGDDNPGSPAFDWISDGYGEVFHPTEATVDPRSWQAISTYRQGETLGTGLPVDAIVEATAALALTNVEVDPNTSGSYLSGFLGLHAVYRYETTPHVAAAGHIHVGGFVAVADARQLMETTLEAVLVAHPVDSLDCPPGE